MKLASLQLSVVLIGFISVLASQVLRDIVLINYTCKASKLTFFVRLVY